MQYSDPSTYAKKIDGVFLPAKELRPLVDSHSSLLGSYAGGNSNYSWRLVEGEEYHHEHGSGGWSTIYTVLESADGPLLMSFERFSWQTLRDDSVDEGSGERVTYFVKEHPFIAAVEEYLATRPQSPEE